MLARIYSMTRLTTGLLPKSWEWTLNTILKQVALASHLPPQRVVHRNKNSRPGSEHRLGKCEASQKQTLQHYLCNVSNLCQFLQAGYFSERCVWKCGCGWSVASPQTSKHCVTVDQTGAGEEWSCDWAAPDRTARLHAHL